MRKAPQVGFSEVKGVLLLHIKQPDGHVIYVRVDKAWDCEKTESTKCPPLVKASPLRRGTPICPCEEKECEEWCHPHPFDPRELENTLPGLFDKDPVPIDHKSDVPPPPPPRDAATDGGN